jgi:hypothetical protein
MSRSFRFRQYPVERNHFSAAQAVFGTAAWTWSFWPRCRHRNRTYRSDVLATVTRFDHPQRGYTLASVGAPQVLPIAFCYRTTSPAAGLRGMMPALRFDTVISQWPHVGDAYHQLSLGPVEAETKRAGTKTRKRPKMLDPVVPDHFRAKMTVPVLPTEKIIGALSRVCL